MLLQQKASYEKTLQYRLAILTKKGVPSPEAEKDAVIRKAKADIKAVNERLRTVAENDRRAEESPKRRAAGTVKPVKASEKSKADKAPGAS
jgi:DNA polymerase III delta prime subunit